MKDTLTLKKSLAALTMFLAIFALTACGGGAEPLLGPDGKPIDTAGASGGGTGTGTGGADGADQQQTATITIHAATLSTMANRGNGCEMHRYDDLNEATSSALVTLSLDDSGERAIAEYELPSSDFDVYVRCDDIDGAVLHGAATLNEGANTVVVTPLSELAYRQARASSGARPDHALYMNRVATMFGLDQVAKTAPAASLSDVNDDAAGRYRLLLLSLQGYMNTRNTDADTNNNIATLSALLDDLNTKITGANLDATFKAALANEVGVVGGTGENAPADARSTLLARLNRQTVQISGQVSGLPNGSTLTLQQSTESSNAQTAVSITIAGATTSPLNFQFTDPLTAGTTYTVSVSNISSPNNVVCTVSNGTGTAVAGVNIDNVYVECSAQGGSLSGTIYNLAKEIVLANGGETISVQPQGYATEFTFYNRLSAGSAYNVSVNSQPDGQNCVIENGAGAAIGDVRDVRIRCRSSNNLIHQVDVVQVFSQPVLDTYQILTPNRAAMVRAYVYANNPPQVVSLRVNNGDVVTMTCNNIPSGAPTTAPIRQQDLSRTCNAVLTAEQVRPGLQLTVTAGSDSQTVTPRVNGKSVISLRLVPLRINNGPEAAPHNNNVIGNYLLARLPLSDILFGQNNARAALTVTSNDWSEILDQLETARSMEAPNSFYYGYVPYVESSFTGLLGLGYVGRKQVGSSPTSAIGYGINIDGKTINSYNFKQNESAVTLAHELAHNLTLEHAPCGAVGAYDSFWDSNPWPGADEGDLSDALINTTYPVTANMANLANPASLGNGKDIMTYCGGEWFSEYSYLEVADHLENYLRSPSGVSGKEVLRISGIIQSGSVTKFFPRTTSDLIVESASQGDYQLRLTFASGKVDEKRFNLVRMSSDSETATYYFAVNFAISEDEGQLNRIEVLHNNQLIGEKQAAQARISNQDGAASSQPLTWNESGGLLNVSWDKELHPWLQVAHIADDGEVNVLAINAQGGQAQFSTLHLPAGGEWEIVLGDGMNTEMTRARR